MMQVTKNEKIDRIIPNILNLLIDKYKPIKIILFGSHAQGKSNEDSDIDLLIIKDTQESFLNRWCTVGAILTGTHPSVPVDTLVLTPQELNKRISIGDQFIVEILENGKILYAA